MHKLRPLHEIARDITASWTKPYFGAVPYIKALHQLSSIDDMYHFDTAQSVVNYLLSNMRYWRGDKAKQIKVELKQHLSSCTP